MLYFGPKHTHVQCNTDVDSSLNVLYHSDQLGEGLVDDNLGH